MGKRIRMMAGSGDYDTEGGGKHRKRGRRISEKRRFPRAGTASIRKRVKARLTGALPGEGRGGYHEKGNTNGKRRGGRREIRQEDMGGEERHSRQFLDSPRGFTSIGRTGEKNFEGCGETCKKKRRPERSPSS